MPILGLFPAGHHASSKPTGPQSWRTKEQLAARARQRKARKHRLREEKKLKKLSQSSGEGEDGVGQNSGGNASEQQQQGGGGGGGRGGGGGESGDKMNNIMDMDATAMPMHCPGCNCHAHSNDQVIDGAHSGIQSST